MLAIPKDAPNPDSAYAYLNYIMTPQVIADISNFKRYANGNLASHSPRSRWCCRQSRTTPEFIRRPNSGRSSRCSSPIRPTRTRAITRVWQKFKTGQ